MSGYAVGVFARAGCFVPSEGHRYGAIAINILDLGENKREFPWLGV